MYGFDFASRFNEVELRDTLLGQLESKPIGVIADSYDRVLCASLATAELVSLSPFLLEKLKLMIHRIVLQLQNLTSRHAKDSKCRDEATGRLMSEMTVHRSACSRSSVNRVYRLWNESTLDSSKLRVCGIPAFSSECSNCNIAVRDAFSTLARSLQ